MLLFAFLMSKSFKLSLVLLHSGKKERETFRLNIGILLLALLEWKYIKIQVASSNKTN